MNKLGKSVSKTDLLREFLKSLNGVLAITNRELELLEELINLQTDKNLDYKYGVINKDTRKHITQKLGITPDNLSRYLKKFRRLGILVPSKQYVDEFVVNSALIPEIIGDRVQITIILRINGNNEN